MDVKYHSTVPISSQMEVFEAHSRLQRESRVTYYRES